MTTATRPRAAIKRIYEPAADSDGTRILIDRLWPRGLSKHEAKVDVWLKDIAPSGPLRKWFGHDPWRWRAFRSRYAAELDGNEGMEELVRLIEQGPVTLLYAARDEEHNHARALSEYLQNGEGRRHGAPAS